MDWKKLGKRLLFPPFWLTILLTAFCAAALVCVFTKGLDESFIAYGVYVLSFYTLVIFCLACAVTLPGYGQKVKSKIYQSSFGSRYMTDAAFKTHVSLYISLTVNFLYSGMNILSYFLYRSMWFVILAGYYSILAIMRFLLLRFFGKHKIGKKRIAELRLTVVCALILLTINFILSGAVLMILYQNRGFVYQGYFIYVMASYTFYQTIHTIIDLVKYRKYKSPVMMTSKVITLSAAFVSMLTLETAMLSQFGTEMYPANKWILITATGAGVSAAVITMSIYMIVRSINEIHKLRSNLYGKPD